MSHFVGDIKERKKAQQKKNKLHQQLFYLARLRREEDKRVKDLEDMRKPKPAGMPSDEEVGDKVAAIRNRLTNKKRISKERWNRFATTGDSGGRGL